MAMYASTIKVKIVFHLFTQFWCATKSFSITDVRDKVTDFSCFLTYFLTLCPKIPSTSSSLQASKCKTKLVAGQAMDLI